MTLPSKWCCIKWTVVLSKEVNVLKQCFSIVGQLVS